MARFKVTGRGEFPFDMLRKDRCWPINGDEANKMGARERRTIELATDEDFLTNGRWNSFGWRIVGAEGWIADCDRVHVADLEAA